MSHSILLPAIGLLAATIISQAAPEPSSIVKPHTVPAVKSWAAATGHLTLEKPSISSNDATAPLAKLLTSEIPGSSIASGTKATITLTLSSQRNNAPTESYQLVVTNKNITIKAASHQGLYYGTRTLLQMLKHSNKLPCGVITDSPKYPVRSLLLDVGRKFIPVDGLKDWIRMMGWMKINELHLHLNDNSWGRYPGYRLESKKFPGLASKDGHYTFAQIRELQDFAKLHAVTIVPEIDSPGHSLAFTTYRPDLAHPEINRNGFGLAYLDLNNPEAIRFMEQIWDEVCPLFDSKLVHIGTDEYRLNLVKDPKERAALGEKFRQYINHLNRYIRKKHGKTVRTWSGYEHMPGKTEPDTNIIIDMWETSDAKNKVKAGYKVVNSSHFYTYIVPGAPYYGVNNTFIYDTWTPMQFSNKPAGKLSPEDPGLMGAKLHVWNDYGPSGYTWNEIARLSLPSMAAMSEKMWGIKGAANYKAFNRYATTLTENIPNVSLTNRNAAGENSTVMQLEKPLLLIPNTQKPLKQKAENLEWPWTASVTLTRHNDVKGDEILLSSDLAAFYLDLTHTAHDKKQKKDITRRGVACVRANQAYGHEPITSNNPDILIFDYQVPVGKKVTLTLVGERRRTSLYVDGKLIQSIGKQMVCPLTRIGDELPRGPHATLHSLNIKSKGLTSVQVGAWSPKTITERPKATNYDLTKTLTAAGNYQIVFQYSGGQHRLDISKVELLENGKVIHTDNHAGVTGGKSSGNIYPLTIKALKPNATYTLRATIHSDGGTDSSGTITLQEAP
ncbi:MAG: beta-N-acetylhexosaminidase [Akkermansiaceae bacterium]